MLAPNGCLVTKAIHEKTYHKGLHWLDACAANLMRPAMYGAYHHITVMGMEHYRVTINMMLPADYVKIMISLGPMTVCCHKLLLAIWSF